MSLSWCNEALVWSYPASGGFPLRHRMSPEVRKLFHALTCLHCPAKEMAREGRGRDAARATEGCDTCLLEQLALIWAAQRSQLFMQIKGQRQAGMWLQAILVRTSPGALVQASDSQFVFLHELSGQALAGKKKSLPWELTQLGSRCNFFCGSGSSVAKSNLWIIIYKSSQILNCLLSI